MAFKPDKLKVAAVSPAGQADGITYDYLVPRVFSTFAQAKLAVQSAVIHYPDAEFRPFASSVLALDSLMQSKLNIIWGLS